MSESKVEKVGDKNTKHAFDNCVQPEGLAHQAKPRDLVDNTADAVSLMLARAEFYADYASARNEFGEIPRKRKATVRMKGGGQYSYNYADLSDVFAAINPALAAYGIGIFQEPFGNEIITTITHKSGYEKVFKFPIKAMPGRSLDDSQSFQSSVQVSKRYALTAHLGISTEETIEGDYSVKRGLPEDINDNFETGDGVRMPRGAKVTKTATLRERAEEAARAIEAQFDEPKTSAGLNGAWNRNDSFIQLLDAKHNDLYQSIFDKFHARLDDLTEKDNSK